MGKPHRHPASRALNSTPIRLAFTQRQEALFRIGPVWSPSVDLTGSQFQAAELPRASPIWQHSYFISHVII